MTTTLNQTDLQRVWQALQSVRDPEIPAVSVVEMGIIADVFATNGRVTVQMTPTFAGCPALDIMRDQIGAAVRNAGFADVNVEVVFDPPWTS